MKKTNRWINMTALFLLLLFLSGCSYKIEADLSSYASEPIQITGLSEEPTVVTPKQLRELKCIRKTVKAQNDKKNVTVQAAGPTLETFLKSCGTSQRQISRVIFVAADGYTKEFQGEYFLTHPDFILSLASGDSPLPEEERPLRLVIPGSTSDQWVKGVKEIRFE